MKFRTAQRAVATAAALTIMAVGLSACGGANAKYDGAYVSTTSYDQAMSVKDGKFTVVEFDRSGPDGRDKCADYNAMFDHIEKNEVNSNVEHILKVVATGELSDKQTMVMWNSGNAGTIQMDSPEKDMLTIGKASYAPLDSDLAEAKIRAVKTNHNYTC